MTVSALSYASIGAISIGTVVGLLVIGFVIALVVSALIVRVLVAVVVIALAVAVWQQRSSIESSVKHSVTQCRHLSFFGVHVDAPKRICRAIR